MEEAIDLPDNTEVELTVVVNEGDDLDAEDRAQLDEALGAAKAELARGHVVPFDQVLAEI